MDQGTSMKLGRRKAGSWSRPSKKHMKRAAWKGVRGTEQKEIEDGTEEAATQVAQPVCGGADQPPVQEAGDPKQEAPSGEAGVPSPSPLPFQSEVSGLGVGAGASS